MNYDRVKSEVVGRWHGVISSISSEARLDGKHGPCPMCGGTDRFRFDNQEGRGTYICNQCGSGDGWDLFKGITGMDFKESMERIAEMIGSMPIMEPTYQPPVDPSVSLNRLWKNSIPISGSDLASQYLRSRHLVMLPEGVRFSPCCYESSTKSTLPAMIARVTDPDGKPVTIHRTYLNGDKKSDIESPKKLMTGTAPLSGAAVRLFPVKDIVGVAEGIETAIAAKQLYDIPTWATISTSVMAGFVPPKGIKRVVVFGDNDANFAGQKAAYALANELYRKDYIVSVEIPDNPGDDWADVVQTYATTPSAGQDRYEKKPMKGDAK